MESRNETTVSEFLLLEVTQDAELQPVLFSLFLSMYLVTILGNLLIILAVISDSHLHTPMYLFLSNLSLADICLSTATMPNMLANIRTRSQSIMYAGCLTQTCFLLVFASLESFLLAVMAYDHYVAICHPLRYTDIMNPSLCGLLVSLSLLMLLQLSFCTDLEISLFSFVQVVKLVCSDTLFNNLLIYFAACTLGGIPLSGIIFSYTQIHKAFSTCGSHLSVVSLFYGTGLGVYISSAVSDSSRRTAVASVMYTVVTSVLNPFIYSLRNKDMKGALCKLVGRIPSLL
uniref:G-protein coupled receptors family 1 profile domain-containing protein n=1 Tax=Prolemur simus TaxID=1328070 RepID=A0A8C9ALL9_PROSS